MSPPPLPKQECIASEPSDVRFQHESLPVYFQLNQYLHYMFLCNTNFIFLFCEGKCSCSAKLPIIQLPYNAPTLAYRLFNYPFELKILGPFSISYSSFLISFLGVCILFHSPRCAVFCLVFNCIFYLTYLIKISVLL